MGSENKFAIELFQFGNQSACCYAYFCPCCALADARIKLDGSSYWLNFFCLPLAPFRWLTRSAYGIGDTSSAVEDILYSVCCPCCVINQLYQTNIQRGNPSADGGHDFNLNDFLSDSRNSCDQFFEGCIFQQCSLGLVMNRITGMPYYLACCCMNVCIVRNILRYQYRIKPTFGDDQYDELLMPIGSWIGGFLLCNPIFGVALQLAIGVQVLREARIRPKCEIRQYLLGFQTENSIPVLSEDSISVEMPESTEECKSDGSPVATAEAKSHFTIIPAESVHVYREVNAERSIFESGIH